MKVLHISIYPPKNKKHSSAGGVASYTKNLITNTPYQNSDKVFILCNKLDNKYEEYEEDNIKVIRCYDKNYKFIFQILKKVKEVNPDIIHIQQELNLYGNIFSAYLLQWLLFLLRKYKTIITIHGVVSLKKINKNFVEENNSNLPAWLVKIAIYIIYKPLCIWSKIIIVHEEYFKNILISEYGISNKKINIIHHGVEDLKSISKEEACKNLGLDSKKDICLFMGYATGYKGIDLLIEGFSSYAKKNPNAYLLIGAGKHPKMLNNKKYIEKYNSWVNKAKKLIPSEQYKWVGFIDEKNIINYFCASDVSIFPYTIAMSSSGPMSIAIGYSKPFLLSNVFEKVLNDNFLIFNKISSDLCLKINEFFKYKHQYKEKVEILKNKRSWNLIGEKLYKLYFKL